MRHLEVRLDYERKLVNEQFQSRDKALLLAVRDAEHRLTLRMTMIGIAVGLVTLLVRAFGK